MIAHVAAAGEQRGRVVLHLTAGTPSPVALAAAMRVAQAFQSEIESLFVEDDQLYDVAGFSFAREISFSGRRHSELSPESIARQMRHMAAALQRQVSALARAAEIPLRSTVVRGNPIRAVAHACTECGPWNVVALAEPLTAGNMGVIRQLFETVTGTTGVVVVGPQARRTEGPVVVIVDDIAHLEPMLRAAERLLGPAGKGGAMRVMLVGRSEAETAEMEGQARLLLGSEPTVTLERAPVRHGTVAEVAETLRRTRSGFVLARFGGLLVPAKGDLRALAAALECPLFLMR